ncbi:SDR family NAD(P)-dependent oxidoreductase [Nocardia fusca]|uniref:SDR family NAD(P)-dependent oxidoreductase n=1 Tax=Nocardia fusca TaxID=941183 RepID=UPI0037AD4EC8
MGKLNGRVAIVTGAAGGIGSAAAIRFAEEGAQLVLTDIVGDRLEEVTRQARDRGAEVVPVIGDVTSADHVAAVIRAAVDAFGQIDVLANIAQGGMDEHTYLADTTAEISERAWRGGPIQTMLFMQQAFPFMRERGYGRIINTGSASAVFGIAGFTAYEMAKSAVQVLTRNAAREWARHGIVTNTFLPVIRTPAFDLTEQGRQAAENMAVSNPTRRFGTAYEDCAPVLVFLASEDAGYVNGQTIGVDGGAHIFA